MHKHTTHTINGNTGYTQVSAVVVNESYQERSEVARLWALCHELDREAACSFEVCDMMQAWLPRDSHYMVAQLDAMTHLLVDTRTGVVVMRAEGSR